MANGQRAVASVAMAAGGLIASITSVAAWSWTGDEAGQKLDQEARRCFMQLADSSSGHTGF